MNKLPTTTINGKTYFIDERLHELRNVKDPNDAERFDSLADGRIDRTELTQLLSDAGIGNWITRGMWADGIVAALDADKDGTISAPELQAAMRG